MFDKKGELIKEKKHRQPTQNDRRRKRYSASTLIDGPRVINNDQRRERARADRFNLKNLIHIKCAPKVHLNHHPFRGGHPFIPTPSLPQGEMKSVNKLSAEGAF